MSSPLITVYVMKETTTDKTTIEKTTIETTSKKGKEPKPVKKSTPLPDMIGKVNKSKITGMSRAVADQLNNGGATVMGDQNAAVFSSPQVTRFAAKVILDWIKSYNTRGDRAAQMLNLSHVGIERISGSNELMKVVEVYAAAGSFKLRPDRRGDALRQAIIGCMQQHALTLAELTTIHQLLSFDRGLLRVMLDCTFEHKYSSSPPVDIDAIEAYCSKNDDLDNMAYYADNRVYHARERVRLDKEVAEAAARMATLKVPVWHTK